jgi:thioredoxin 1
MSFQSQYANPGPSRADVEAVAGPLVLEFGTPWCGWCRAAQPLIAEGFAVHPHLTHLKVEDGSGRSLGRSFGVKLWPTVLFLKDGREIARLVRLNDVATVRRAFASIDPAPA